MLEAVKRLWLANRAPALERSLDHLRHHTPVPVFWLFGKTQSGKTSVIKYLTGAAEAEIGEGFRPCTRTSRIYQFPTPDAPLIEFLDTRGLDEPGYDAAEDIARFNHQAHLVLVTVKLLDHALENLLAQLRKVRAARPSRPIVLAVTCLHEAYPQRQHPPYPFGKSQAPNPKSQNDYPADWDLGFGAWDFPQDALRSLAEQERRFAGLADAVVPIDLTWPEEGFHEPNYGGEHLRAVLLEKLPEAYRQTLRTLDLARREFRGRQARESMPLILGYSALAATAGAVPIPWLDLLILPGMQSRMIAHLAERAGRPMDGRRFAELAASLGLGLLARQALREVVKLVPYVGSVAGAALAAASTYALGQAYLYYERAVLEGHVPSAAELRRVYREQLSRAEGVWKTRGQESGVRSQ
jgi:uncharacterized protein (DUF697 family)